MIIYKILNKINNKIYIGQTTRSVKDRMEEHCKPYNKSYLSKAIRKYGKDNFQIDELEMTASIEKMNELEKYYIVMFNSKSPNGYNVLEGGRESSRIRSKTKGRPLSEAHKKKIGLANKGKIRTDAMKEVQSKLKKGTKLSKNTRKQISLSNIGKHHEGRKIIDKQTSLVYISIVEASRETRVPTRTIFRHANSQVQKPRFYYFFD